MTFAGTARIKALPVLLVCLLALAGCVTDPTQVSVGTAAPPMGKVATGVYGAVQDGNYLLPAVPVEKVPVEFQRQTVAYVTDQPTGTIIINTQTKFLYLVTGKNMAIRYGIGVGRAGFEWSGEAIVSDRKPYPTWTPPAEMIERKPELAKWAKGQPGSPQNPLGARALYLTTDGVDYGYRIHGTPEWFTIGKSASSGCIRMIHQDVIDLYNRVPLGTKVIVLTPDGKMPKGLTLPPHQPDKKKAEPAPIKVSAEPAMPALPPPPALDPELVAAPPPPAAAP